MHTYLSQCWETVDCDILQMKGDFIRAKNKIKAGCLQDQWMETSVYKVPNLSHLPGDKIDRGGKNIMDMYVNCFTSLS